MQSNETDAMLNSIAFTAMEKSIAGLCVLVTSKLEIYALLNPIGHKQSDKLMSVQTLLAAINRRN
jgi:hypothetical protein